MNYSYMNLRIKMLNEEEQALQYNGGKIVFSTNGAGTNE